MITQTDLKKYGNPHGFKLSTLKAIAQRKKEHADITATDDIDTKATGRSVALHLLEHGRHDFTRFCTDILEKEGK